MPRANVFPKPARLSWAEAASFPLAGLTAYRALFSRGRLRGGETVLVQGAGSGVSTFAVQLAVHEGARVLVTSSSQEKLARAVELGAAGGALYTEDGWIDEIRSLAGGQGVDLALDSAGLWADSLGTLRPGGRLVVFGATAAKEAALAVRPYYFAQHSILGTTMGSPGDFGGLLRVVNHGSWSPVIDSVRPLADAAEAHRRIDAGEQFGKLVLEISLDGLRPSAPVERPVPAARAGARVPRALLRRPDLLPRVDLAPGGVDRRGLHVRVGLVELHGRDHHVRRALRALAEVRGARDDRRAR